jgi:hypothetical protein
MNLRVLELQKKIRLASCYSVLSGVSSRQILTGRIIYDVPLEGESTKLNPSASPFRLFFVLSGVTGVCSKEYTSDRIIEHFI